MSSTDDVSDVESISNDIKGFQFEPIKKTLPDNDDDGWSTYDDLTDEEVVKERKSVDVKLWCTCGNCNKMATEKECFCCKELDALDVLNIKGIHS